MSANRNIYPLPQVIHINVDFKRMTGKWKSFNLCGFKIFTRMRRMTTKHSDTYYDDGLKWWLFISCQPHLKTTHTHTLALANINYSPQVRQFVNSSITISNCTIAKSSCGRSKNKLKHVKLCNFKDTRIQQHSVSNLFFFYFFGLFVNLQLQTWQYWKTI